MLLTDKQIKSHPDYTFIKSYNFCSVGISSITCHPNTKEVYFANYNGEIENFERTIKLQQNTDKISKILFLDDENLLSHGKEQFTIWNEDKEKIVQFQPNKEWTRSVTLFKNETIVLTAGKERDGIKKFHLQDLYKQKFEPFSTLPIKNNWIYSIANIKDKYYGFSMGEENYQIRSLENDEKLKTFHKKSFKTNLCCLYIEHLDYLVLGNYDHSLVFVDVSSEDPSEWDIFKDLNLKGSIPSIISLPNNRLAASHYKGSISIIDLNSLEIIIVLTTGNDDIDDLVLVNGKYLYACDEKGNVYVWNVNNVPERFINQLKKQQNLDIKFYFL